jgi:hypothetical protein
MTGIAVEHPMPASLPAVPSWVSIVGWISVAGCVGFSAAVWYEVTTLPSWDIQAGVIDFFLPGPRALAMLLWELAHVWLVVLVVALVLGKRRVRRIRSRDRLLLISLLGGVLSGGILYGELAARGVTIGIPGVDHHLGSWVN